MAGVWLTKPLKASLTGAPIRQRLVAATTSREKHKLPRVRLISCADPGDNFSRLIVKDALGSRICAASVSTLAVCHSGALLQWANDLVWQALSSVVRSFSWCFAAMPH